MGTGDQKPLQAKGSNRVEEASANVSECKAQSDVRQDPGREWTGDLEATAEACLRSRM